MPWGKILGFIEGFGAVFKVIHDQKYINLILSMDSDDLMPHNPSLIWLETSKQDICPMTALKVKYKSLCVLVL